MTRETQPDVPPADGAPPGGTRAGEMALTVTETGAGLDVAVTGGKPMDAALLPRLAALAERGLAEAGLPGLLVPDAKAALDVFKPPYVIKADGLAAGKGVAGSNQ